MRQGLLLDFENETDGWHKGMFNAPFLICLTMFILQFGLLRQTSKTWIAFGLILYILY